MLISIFLKISTVKLLKNVHIFNCEKVNISDKIIIQTNFFLVIICILV